MCMPTKENSDEASSLRGTTVNTMLPVFLQQQLLSCRTLTVVIDNHHSHNVVSTNHRRKKMARSKSADMMPLHHHRRRPTAARSSSDTSLPGRWDSSSSFDSRKQSPRHAAPRRRTLKRDEPPIHVHRSGAYPRAEEDSAPKQPSRSFDD